MIWIVSGVVILAGIAFAAGNFFQEELSLDAVPAATVERGELRISITESGTLQALQTVTLASEITSNRAKIVSIAPEGSYVEKGDLVIAFDKTAFEEELRKLRHEIAQVKAAIVEAADHVKLQRVKNESDLKEAQADILAADAELKNIQEGEGVITLRELEMKKQRSQAAYNRAVQNVADLQDMLQSGFITRNELKKAELNLQEAESEYHFIEQKREIFMQFTRPSQIEQAKSNARERREHLSQLKEVAAYLISAQQANLKKEQARLQGLQEKYQRALKELQKTSIYAPIPGLVIYNEIPASGKTRKIQVGDAVWSHQGLIGLPDISHMLVETQIREVDIHYVRLGQNVRIHVDAYPDNVYTGKVHLIGSLAKSDDHQRTGSKYFQVQVLLDTSDSRLRPGMTARVDILVNSFEDVLYVPLEGVFERDGEKRCYVVNGRKAEERIVQNGAYNDDFIIVTKGLSEGERIYLHDPSTLLLK